MAKKESSLKGSGYSAEQAKAAQQMADAMERMARFAPSVERSFITQADVLSKMTASMQAFAGQQTVDNLTKICDALKCISDNIGAIDPSKLAALGTQAGSTQTVIIQMTESVKHLNQNIQGIDSKSINKFSDSTKKAGKQIQNVTKNEFGGFKDLLKSKFPIAAGIAGGAISGLIQGFRNLMALSKGLFGFISTLTKSLFKIGSTLLSIPLKVFDGLINMADQGGGGISELAEAINGMRKEFGALSGPTNSAIMGTAKAMGNLHLAGTSVLRVFGNQADRLKMLTELYAQSGSNLRSFEKEILATNGAAIALQKGLGLSAENMESFAARAKSTGQPITKMLINVTKQADQMGKAFGLDAKIISKEMGKAAQDFKNFGNVSEKQLAVAVTYAEKLGLKLDKITGTMDAFGTFDDAADNVSKLNEAFGTNIDAMEILQAQSPEEKMEILRREMRKAGVEGEKLNAAQRKLIAGAAGMDDQTSIAAFSTKNYGISLGNIKKEGDKAEKKTLTQAEAIEKLSDAMERMLKSGESGLTGGKGLLGAFLNGISRGIQMHPDFINMMRNIKQTIYQVFAGGIKVGRDFVDLFPGIKGMLQSITKIFDPAKVAALMNRVRDIFKQFFTDLSDPNKKGSVSALMTKLKDTFFNFFDKKSPEGSELLGHFGKFKDAVIKIFNELAVWMIEKLAGIITSITEWIKNPKMPKVDASGAATSILSPFQEVIDKAGEVLWPAIKNLGLTIWEKLKEALTDPANKKYLYGAMATIAAVVLGPALVQGIAGGITGALAKKALGGEGGGGGVVGMVKDIFAGGNAEKAVAEAAEGAGAQAAKGGASFLESPAELVKSALPDEETIKQMEAASKASINWAALADFLLGMAGMFAIGLAAFKVALEIVKGTSIADLGKAALVMGVLIPVMQGMSELVGPLSEIKDVPFTALIKTLAGVAALMLVGLGALWLALKVVNGVPLMDIVKAGIAVGAVAYMMSEMPGVFLAIKMVSKTMDKAGGPAKMAIALAAMGVTVIAMAAVAWVAIKMLGKFSLAAVATTTAAVAGMELLFAGAGALLVVAGAVGAAATGPQILMAAVGFAAMAAAIIALAKVAQITIKMLGGFSMAQVGVTVAALMGMELLMAGAAALIVVAGGIGAMIIASFGAGAAAILIGAKALDKAIIKISETAVELINKLGEIPMGKITTTMTVMTMALLLFGEAGLLIVEAAAIGAGLISTLGVGAAAIKIGMETITNAVNIMAGTVIGVMLDLEKIKEDPAAVETKANAFSSILSAISELTDSIAGIIDSFDFGFFDDPEDIATKVGSVQSFIESLIEGRDGKGGIKGIVESITQGLKEVSAESLERGKAIAEILAAVGTLMETMVGPAMELSKQAGGMWKSSKKQAEDAKLLIGNVTEFITTLAPTISGLVTIIVSTMKELTAEQVTALEKGGPAVAAILTAVGKLVEVIKPGNVNIQGLNTVGPQGQAAGVTLTQQAPNIQEVFKAAIQHLPALFDTIVKLIGSSPTGEEFEKKAESAKKIFEVIAPITELIKSITEMSKEKFDWKGARETAKEMLQGIEGYLFQLFTGDSGTIQGVIGHIVTLGKHIEAGSESAKKVKDLAGPAVTAIKEVSDKLAEVLQGNVPDRENAKKYLKDSEGYLFQLIAGEGTIQGVLSKLNEIKTHITGSDTTSITEGLNNFNETLKSASSAVELMGATASKFESAKGNADALKNNFNNFTESLKTVEGVFAGFEGVDTAALAPAFKNMLVFGINISKATDLLLKVFSDDSASNAEKLTKNIKNVKAMIENGIVPAAVAVKDMVRAADEIQSAIDAGAKFDINKKLKVFTANSQKFLGTGGKYTVTTKDVNINVNFKVVIDSAELSSTIVQNKSSVIRQRINLLMSAVRDDDSGKQAKEDAKEARFKGTELPSQLTTYEN